MAVLLFSETSTQKKETSWFVSARRVVRVVHFSTSVTAFDDLGDPRLIVSSGVDRFLGNLL